MNKTNKTIKIVLIIFLLCVIAFGVYKYFNYKSYCNSHFQSNTVINGIDCSGLTKDETIDKLTSQWNKHKFTITEEGRELLVLKNLNFTYDIKKSVTKAMDDASKFPLYSKLFKKTAKLTINMTPNLDNDNFKKQINTLSIFDTSDDIVTKNAYLDLSNTDCKIVDEVYGTNVSRSDFEKKISDLISNGTWKLSYQKKDFYEQPTIKATNKKLLQRQAYAKEYLTFQIKYTFGSDSYTITPAQLDEMISVDSKGTSQVKKAKVKEFVEKLAAKYNTAGSSIQFNSTSSGTVTVPPGSYGYIISQDGEVKSLTKNLQNRKDVTREPEYAQEGAGWSNGGVGNTYVEISIGAQHLWYYQNGNLVVSTDVVTGNVSEKTTTPTGAYYLEYKSSDATLKGENTDGSKYETPVSCWMPFSGGYGMHDAYWRDKFGGNIYKTGGSHGCVNMPTSQAKKLFNVISEGCPVMIY